MILPSDMQEFLNSAAIKEIEATFEEPIPAYVVPGDIYDKRDYLLFRLVQTNAQRPMAITGITARKVERVEMNEDGGAVVPVSTDFR